MSGECVVEFEVVVDQCNGECDCLINEFYVFWEERICEGSNICNVVDIYFQLVEECQILSGGFFVDYVGYLMVEVNFSYKDGEVC